MSWEKLRVVGSLLVALTALACGEDVKSNGQPPADAGPTDTGGSTGDGAPDAPPPGDTRPCEGSTLTTGSGMLMHGGLQYNYLVHVPPSYDGTKRTPLVLNWHGRNSIPMEQQLFTQTDPLSDEEGFIVVYPGSPDKSWNGGTCCPPSGDAGLPEHDDVGFARAIVTEISGKACIDSKRVYSMGMSNGGFMSHRLACEAADMFAAVESVAGQMGIPNCQPSRPISVLHHHGTGDMSIPYGVSMFSAEGLGVADMMARWGTRNGCTKGPDTTFQMGTVTCQTWSQCSAGVLVTLCSAEGAEHCWPGASFCPGGKPYATEISASRDGWAFLKQFVLP